MEPEEARERKDKRANPKPMGADDNNCMFIRQRMMVRTRAHTDTDTHTQLSLHRGIRVYYVSVVPSSV